MFSPPPALNAHGGARPGAGRKPNVVKYEHPIQDATERCANRLPQTLDELEQLAQGVPLTHERWVAAGTLTIGRGKDARPAFPDLPPDQLVLVARTTTSAKPDARAVLYLADRVLGRLTTSDQTFLEEQLGAELQLFINRICARFSPDLANAIFQAVAFPDNTPQLSQDDLQTLAEQMSQEQGDQEDETLPEEQATPKNDAHKGNTPTQHTSVLRATKTSTSSTTANALKHASPLTPSPPSTEPTPRKAPIPHKPPK